MRKFIKPSRPGLLVRNHQDKLRPLGDEGKAVLWDQTWARRLRDGDVIEVKPRKAEKAPEKPTSKKPVSTPKIED